MGGIFKSPVFQEFLQKRCEEITTNDKEYVKINDLILKKEAEIELLASGDLLKKISEYEDLNLNLIACAETLLYEQAIKDFHE